MLGNGMGSLIRPVGFILLACLPRKPRLPAMRKGKPAAKPGAKPGATAAAKVFVAPLCLLLCPLPHHLCFFPQKSTEEEQTNLELHQLAGSLHRQQIAITSLVAFPPGRASSLPPESLCLMLHRAPQPPI